MCQHYTVYYSNSHPSNLVSFLYFMFQLAGVSQHGPAMTLLVISELMFLGLASALRVCVSMYHAVKQTVNTSKQDGDMGGVLRFC